MSIERQFAEKLDGREDIKLFMKLPAKFKVPTPVGEYNPDWAILKHEDGEDREQKPALHMHLLEPVEISALPECRAP